MAQLRHLQNWGEENSALGRGGMYDNSMKHTCAFIVMKTSQISSQIVFLNAINLLFSGFWGFAPKPHRDGPRWGTSVRQTPCWGGSRH